jgi:type VI secretion system protein ImpM
VITVAPELPDDPVPGWFGKLACLGDFASRRLPPPFVRVCDTWLSEGVDASRQQLGERWLDTYLTSPLWRFAWAPGVVDEMRWWFGVLMPSVDSVGRYFPLVVALPLRIAPQDGEALDRLERWFSEVSQAALGTLQPGSTLERFEGELHGTARLDPGWRDTLAPEEMQWIDRTAYRFAGGAGLRRSLRELARHDAAQRMQGRTLWWPLRLRGGESRLTIASGLPRTEAFGELLRGGW